MNILQVTNIHTFRQQSFHTFAILFYMFCNRILFYLFSFLPAHVYLLNFVSFYAFYAQIYVNVTVFTIRAK